MSYGRDIWIDEYERICEAFLDGEIEEEEARTRLKALGLDSDEIDENVRACRDQQDTEESAYVR